jgi:hypothetical protein
MAKGLCRLDRQKRLCLFEGHKMLFWAGSKMKGSCRLGAQAAMIRHLVVEKISLTPDFSTITYLIFKVKPLILPFKSNWFF